MIFIVVVVVCWLVGLLGVYWAKTPSYLRFVVAVAVVVVVIAATVVCLFVCYVTHFSFFILFLLS